MPTILEIADEIVERVRTNHLTFGITMSADHTNQNVSCVQLESYDRITKIPVVESTLQTSKNIYDKVKEFNSLTNWTMSTAENTVYKAVEVGKPYASPVVQSLEGPIKKVDGMICTGLDYVESKVPAVKLPPGELLLQIYNSTKEFVQNSSTVQTACSVVKPAMDTAKNLYEPAVETAKNTVQGAKSMVEPAFESAKSMVEPAVQTAKTMVEPYVQSSMDKAAALKEFGTQKYEQYVHGNAQPATTEGETVEECSDCQENSQKN